MRACGEVDGVDGTERVYKEMVRDGRVRVGWSSLATLVNLYVNAGLREKAILTLREAEKKLTARKRLGYSFLITLYSSLGDKEGVVRVWEASKAAGGRIACGNYVCLVVLGEGRGEIGEAKRVFMVWEAGCRKYDVRVSNVMLGAYVRNGLMRKAEALQFRVMERGGRPNYKTWEILMEGWVKCGKMDKAVDARGFALLKDCDWRPSQDVLMPIAEEFEKRQNHEGAIEFIRVINQMGIACLLLYRILLRMHLRARRPAHDLVKMMEKDGIAVDHEPSTLVDN